MKDGKTVFNIKTKGRELLAAAPRIEYNGRETDLYYARSLHAAYEKLYGITNFDLFWHAFYKVPEYAVFPNDNPLFTVVCEKKSADRGLVNAIVSSAAGSAASPRKTPRKGTDGPASKKFKSHATNLQSSGYMLDAESSDVAAGLDAENTLNSPSLSSSKGRSIYDELESSDDMQVICATAKKIPAAGPKAAPAAPTFQEIKDGIVRAFGTGHVLPVAGAHGALAAAGSGFDYRTAPCKIPRHPHSNLTKFFACCKDIAEIKTLSVPYLVLRTPAAEHLEKKRKHAYFVPPSDPAFNYFTEALIVNMFAVKSRVPLDDFTKLFRHIYGREFGEVVKASPSRWLDELSSPNIRLTDSKGVCAVTFVPGHSYEYTRWQPDDIAGRIASIEGNFDGGAIASAAAGAVSNVALSQVFPAADGRVLELMRIADLNVPKHVLESTADCLPESLDYSPLWRVLRHSVNFDDQRTFFT
ncbi:hypothetical protein PAPHI01_1137 [Pancytospora philotis]|nr:hypothetical protein PAPHI01_1137 [Pancytospora philotis]